MHVDPSRVNVQYTAYQEQKNKSENKAKTMKEQWTTENELNH